MSFSWKKFQFPALYGLILVFVLVPFMVNCSLDPAAAVLPGQSPGLAADNAGTETPASLPLAVAAFNAGSDTLWADAAGAVPPPGTPPSTSSRVSLDVRDANILDVLSVLALKMGAHVIFLEEPTLVTFKSSNLSALTTFQLLLQKEGLDYLVVHGHYIVGERDRLYDDFYNRMILSRYSMQYISAQEMQNLIRQLEIPVENVTVDVNTQEIWVQGTPMALGKFMELLSSVDRRTNAAFDTGGTRTIRLPVSYAEGAHARAELEALVELLKILLHGHLGGNLDEIRLVISPNIAAGTSVEDMRYLYVEGTPDNIELVRNMIDELRDSMSTLPFSFGAGESEAESFSWAEPEPEEEPEPEDE